MTNVNDYTPLIPVDKRRILDLRTPAAQIKSDADALPKSLGPNPLLPSDPSRVIQAKEPTIGLDGRSMAEIAMLEALGGRKLNTMPPNQDLLAQLDAKRRLDEARLKRRLRQGASAQALTPLTEEERVEEKRRKNRVHQSNDRKKRRLINLLFSPPPPPLTEAERIEERRRKDRERQRVHRARKKKEDG